MIRSTEPPDTREADSLECICGEGPEREDCPACSFARAYDEPRLCRMRIPLACVEQLVRMDVEPEDDLPW